MWALQAILGQKLTFKVYPEKFEAPGFCVLKTKGYEGTLSKRGEERLGLIQPPVEQQNRLSYFELIAARCWWRHFPCSRLIPDGLEFNRAPTAPTFPPL